MMYVGISIISCSLIYSILVMFMFLLKPHFTNKETKLYKYLLICNITNLLLELGCFITIANINKIPLITMIISKLFLISLLVWNIIFAIYAIFICVPKKTRSTFMIKSELILMFTSIVIISLSKLEYYHQNNVMYSYGPSTDYLTLIYVFNLILCLIISIKNYKNFSLTKMLPLYVLIMLVVFCVLVRTIEPGLNIISCIISFTTLFMYFTIENPDVKLINQLEIAKDQAEKANQAKTEFLSSMSHEIRTPLNAIVGFSECMLSSTNLKETKGFAKDVVDASQNLLEIVNGILDISKIEANKMEVIKKEYNPRQVFNSLVKLVTPRIKEKNIDFKVNISPDLPGVLKGDMGKLKQVVLNLLTNAAKYTEKGEIEFSITCVNRIDIKKCLLYVAVKDTGRGIKKDDIKKLFTKFERIEEDRNATIEGTGLGLAITKSLTEMMDGKITVNSDYGEGSTFRVYLEQEIISMEIPENNEEEITIDYSKNNGKRILIVDDSKMNLKVANQILKPYDFNVKLVESGYECLELMERETFDLILMDIMMPKMNGVEALRRLNELEGFDIPVVALTADAIEGTEEKYKNAGFNDYLSKPIDKYELDRVLNKFLGGKNNE